MTLVTVTDVVIRLDPQPPPDSYPRIEVLLEDAEELIRVAFLRAGQNLDGALEMVEWMVFEVRRVIREMVSAAIIVGPNAGVRTATSTTGQESDSITYADVDSVSFGGVRLTDSQRRCLGLPAEGMPVGNFPPAWVWPERRRPRG